MLYCSDHAVLPQVQETTTGRPKSLAHFSGPNRSAFYDTLYKLESLHAEILKEEPPAVWFFLLC